jgi:Family of unknown function (DUF7019)
MLKATSGSNAEARMRYYHYISANRVEMIYQQLAHRYSVRSTEVGVDVKFVKAIRKIERKSADTSIYEKLSIVEDWIYQNEEVGSIEEPATWISARISLRVATGISDPWNAPPHPIKYGGITPAGSAILLGGSSNNLTTAIDAPTPQINVFGDPAYLRNSFEIALHSAFEASAHSRRAEELASPAGHQTDSTEMATRDRSRREVEAALVYIRFGMEDNGLPPGDDLGECEFLAKTVHSVRANGKTVTVATPLYVSLME